VANVDTTRSRDVSAMLNRSTQPMLLDLPGTYPNPKRHRRIGALIVTTLPSILIVACGRRSVPKSARATFVRARADQPDMPRISPRRSSNDTSEKLPTTPQPHDV